MIAIHVELCYVLSVCLPSVLPSFFFFAVILLFILFFFFFSSRRRHTRCLSDWSSDVCSSDLASFGFRLLFTISLIDSAARMGFLTFLPFLLQAKGAAIAQIGLALTLVLDRKSVV